MSQLFVKPAKLEGYAVAQDNAGNKATELGGATSQLETNGWLYQGVVSGYANVAYGKGHEARKKACDAIAGAAHSLAAKLRAAKETYEGADAQLADTLNKQVLDK
jgi:ESX secretion-associated protein EspC/F